jgi:hypothetical protein
VELLVEAMHPLQGQLHVPPLQHPLPLPPVHLHLLLLLDLPGVVPTWLTGMA